MEPMHPTSAVDSQAMDRKACSAAEELERLNTPLSPSSFCSQRNPPHEVLEVIHGIAFPLRETGSDLLLWAVQADSNPGYHGVRCLGAGDLLIIESPEGVVLFADTIDPDYETGAVLRRKDDSRKVIQALDSWIHWSQRGWPPDDWARLFLDEKNRAVLHRLTQEQPTPT